MAIFREPTSGEIYFVKNSDKKATVTITRILIAKNSTKKTLSLSREFDISKTLAKKTCRPHNETNNHSFNQSINQFINLQFKQIADSGGEKSGRGQGAFQVEEDVGKRRAIPS